MTPVAVGAVVIGVWAAVDLVIFWAIGGFRAVTPHEPRFETLGDEPSWSWPEPPWDVQAIRTTLAEIETL